MLSTDRVVLAAALCAFSACNAESGERATAGSSPADGVPGDTGAATGEEGTGNGQTSNPNDAGSAADDGSEGGLKFDLGNGGFCETKNAGLFCDGAIATQCDGNGGATDTTVCTPEICVEGEGCVTCTAGQWTCKGPRVIAIQ